MDIQNNAISIIGCSYTTDRPGNLTQYSQWLYNGQVSSNLNVGSLTGKFENIAITSYVSWGEYACQVTIGSETFTSQTLAVDEFPGDDFDLEKMLFLELEHKNCFGFCRTFTCEGKC